METIENGIDISSAPERVFEYVSDPSNTLDYMVSMVAVRGIEGSGEGQRFEWTYKMLGVPLDGSSVVTQSVPNQLRAMKSRGGIESEWALKIAPTENGSRLDIRIDYEIPVPVLGKLAERMVVRRNERELALSLQNIKDACEN
ncbi:MAG: SRPBCC family protein [Myxococcota bacterium]